MEIPYSHGRLNIEIFKLKVFLFGFFLTDPIFIRMTVSLNDFFLIFILFVIYK